MIDQDQTLTQLIRLARAEAVERRARFRATLKVVLAEHPGDPLAAFEFICRLAQAAPKGSEEVST